MHLLTSSKAWHLLTSSSFLLLSPALPSFLLLYPSAFLFNSSKTPWLLLTSLAFLAFIPCCSLFLEYISSLLKKLLRDWVFCFPQKPSSLLVFSCLITSIIIVQTTTQSLLSRANILHNLCVLSYFLMPNSLQLYGL